jgi:hypothetical protein
MKRSRPSGFLMPDFVNKRLKKCSGPPLSTLELLRRIERTQDKQGIEVSSLMKNLNLENVVPMSTDPPTYSSLFSGSQVGSANRQLQLQLLLLAPTILDNHSSDDVRELLSAINLVIDIVQTVVVGRGVIQPTSHSVINSADPGYTSLISPDNRKFFSDQRRRMEQVQIPPFPPEPPGQKSPSPPFGIPEKHPELLATTAIRKRLLEREIPYLLEMQHHQNLRQCLDILSTINRILNHKNLNESLLLESPRELRAIREHTFNRILPKLIYACAKSCPNELHVLISFVKNLTRPQQFVDSPKFRLYVHLIPDLIAIVTDRSLRSSVKQEAWGCLENLLRCVDSTLQDRAKAMGRLGVFDMLQRISDPEFLPTAALLGVRLRLAGGLDSIKNSGDTCRMRLERAYKDFYGADFFIAYFLLILSPLTTSYPDFDVFSKSTFKQFQSNFLPTLKLPDVCILMCIMTWLRAHSKRQDKHWPCVTMFYMAVSRGLQERLPVAFSEVKLLESMENKGIGIALMEVFLYKIPLNIDAFSRLLNKFEGEERGCFIFDCALGNWDQIRKSYYTVDDFVKEALSLSEPKIEPSVVLSKNFNKI